ncbi:hypothetical protein PR048_009496 [Dryococelus australis]|uniref:Uncharacterized protein n=1 Tax=Dryococelus australis TaxID=614101 RepID=A0ABQ9I032_9NEOP|nr:hypothetical protein PR048_009496 [Dryococelus australis]
MSPIPSGKVSFKVNFFFVVLDTAIGSLAQRFELMECHSKNFSFFYDIRKLQEWDGDELKAKYMQLTKMLTDGEKYDKDGQELYQELLILPSMLPSGSSPANVLNHINNILMGIFPNVFISLRIIKNYLRSTMSQERLCGLATKAIENYVLKTIETSKFLKEFVTLKS